MFSGLLIGWELVGIDLSKIEYANSLKNPQAVPFVLIVLVLYFSFRVGIEWKLNDNEGRSSRAAQTDITVSYLIAMMSLALFGTQRVLEVQLFAEFLASSMTEKVVNILSSSFIGLGLNALGWKTNIRVNLLIFRPNVRMLGLIVVLVGLLSSVVFSWFVRGNAGFAVIISLVVVFMMLIVTANWVWPLLKQWVVRRTNDKADDD